MFKDSRCTELSPWSLREEATSLPTDILPCYLGSGDCVFSVDASGMQGLNHGAQRAFNVPQNSGDMYVVRNGMIGDQLSPMNTLPFGYFEWDMVLDGVTITSANLAEHAAVWCRRIHIDEATVLTLMVLDTKVTLDVAAWIPYGTACPVFEFGVTGYDFQNKPIEPARKVRLRVGIHLTTRQGKRLYDRASASDGSLRVSVEGHERYEYELRLTNDRGLSPIFDSDWFGLTWEIDVGGQPEHLTCAFSFEGLDAAKNVDRLRNDNARSWASYYSSMCDIRGLEARELYLYHNSLYLFRAGFNPDLGLTIGAPFFFPWFWKASTFWDSNQVADAIMRAGNRDFGIRFASFLHAHMRSEGKPFPWMFIYDGTPAIDDARDMAPLVIAAHAMTAIKAFEYFRDSSFLRDVAYPICKRCADYAVESLFGESGGEWTLSRPVSNDVVDEAPEEQNQTYTLVWFLVIVKKTVEYARIIGKSGEIDRRYADILAHHRIDHNQAEYFHCAGRTASAHRAASWIPFLLYPTEGEPFVDRELLGRTRQKYSFKQLYMEKQGDFQPWTDFMEASSDFRRGDDEAGHARLLDGLEHTYGPGYFSEVGPRQESAWLPPYVSAHGTYVAALLYQFVSTSIWEKRIGIFSHLPHTCRNRSIAIRDVHCAGDVRVSGTYDEYEVTADIEGDAHGLTIDMPLPARRPAAEARVFVNDIPVPFACDPSKGAVSITLHGDEPRTRISLR
jgi:hypothetical protein